ncbi:MAG: serine hydrolase [Elainellaceae cyanobacterium]
MHWSTRIMIGSATALLAIASGSAGWATRALAPNTDLPERITAILPDWESLEDLRQIRDRFQTQMTQTGAAPRYLPMAGALLTPNEQQQLLQSIDTHIHVESLAQQTWDDALDTARRAVKLGKKKGLDTEELGEIDGLWREAIAKLARIPEDSLLGEAAQDKQVEYAPNLAEIAYRYDTARSDFLVPIAETAGLGTGRVRITICHIETRECRRLNGKKPPDSPASLIKLPIGVAVMQKVIDEGVDLDQPILVDRHNYTEDASDVRVGVEYPMRRVLRRMINDSSNIATNQMLDFVGFDYTNEVLSDRGYKSTFVGHKLVGETTFPKDFGKKGTNRTTTDEITEMMVQIYNFENEGDDVLLDSLVEQWDWKLGYAGLKQAEGDVFWIGEKTGQNSKVLGTTVAAKINDQRYVITVTLDRSAHEAAVRRIVKEIAEHIAENDGF